MLLLLPTGLIPTPLLRLFWSTRLLLLLPSRLRRGRNSSPARVPAMPTVLLAAVVSTRVSVLGRSWLKKGMAGVGLEMRNRMITQLVP